MKNFIIFFLVLCVYPAFGQISIFSPDTSNTTKTISKKIIPYDSLTNIIEIEYSKGEKGYHHLIGQKIFLVSADKSFKANKLINGERTFVWYKNLINKYFTVIDVERSPHYPSTDRFILKMDGDSLHTYVCGGDGEDNSKWIVVGYYEKLTKRFKGKDLILTRDYYHPSNYETIHYDGIINSKTKRALTDFPKNTIWHCSDVSVYPDYIAPGKLEGSRIILVLENPEYGQHYIFVDSEFNLTENSLYSYNGLFALKSDVEASKKKAAQSAIKKRELLIAKYGKEKGELIYSHKVKIGMTKEECIDSWGRPIKINSTTNAYGTSEQWVYSKGYLYFDGNILRSIQESY